MTISHTLKLIMIRLSLLGLLIAVISGCGSAPQEPPLPTLVEFPQETPVDETGDAAENIAATAVPEAQSAAETAPVAEKVIPTEEAQPEPVVKPAEAAPAEPVIIEAPAGPVPSQIVIRFDAKATQEERFAYLQEISATILQDIDALDMVLVEVPQAVTAQSLPQSSVTVANEPNYYATALIDVPTSDPDFGGQWALPIIGATQAWQTLPTDAPPVIVAVIDSGICADHADLKTRTVPGWDYIDDDADPQDEYGHGCAVAGIIGASVDNGVGMAGVAPNALILPLRVLDAQGIGTYADVAAAIVAAADSGAQVINLSLGGPNPSGILESAVDYAHSKGSLVIAAAGNIGGMVLYPAAYQPVIAVGSVDRNLEMSSFSGRGPEIDVLAPGRDILATQRSGGTAPMTGTSFAAPQVSGAAALEIAQGRTLNLDGGILRIGQVEAPPPPPEETPIPEAPDDLTAEEQALIDRVRAEGKVRVIVGLAVSFSLEAELSEKLSAAQQVSVQQARNELVSSLSLHEVTILGESDRWIIPYVALEVDEGALQALLSSPLAARIDPERTGELFLNSSIGVIEGDEAWARGLTGTGQTVALLDTGVDRTHPFLGGRVVNEACYSNNLCPNGQTSQVGLGASSPNNCTFYYGDNGDCAHGMNVAGIMASSDSTYKGVAPSANIISVNVFSASGQSSRPFFTDSAVLNALNWIYTLRNTYSIASVNLSLGYGGLKFTSTCDTFNPSYKSAIDLLRGAGIATVIASGNDGFTNGISFPACISTAVSVGATTDADSVASFSNRSTLLHLFAPGVNITSAGLNGNTITMSGTSQATPHVAGAFAIIKGALPGFSVTQILDALRNNGVAIAISGGSVPRIDMEDTLDAILGPPINNDLFADARMIAAVPSTQTQDIFGSTKSITDPAMCAGGTGITQNTVWFKYTSTVNRLLQIDTAGSPYDTVLGVYTGTEGSLTQIVCNDDVGIGDTTSLVTFNAAANTTYYIVVAKYNTAATVTTNLFLNISQLISNDLFANAEVVSGLPASYNQEVNGSTTSGDDPTTCTAAVSNTVWYQYTAPASFNLSLSTANSTYDTVLAVYTGSPGAFTQIVCNDDSAGTLQSNVTLPVMAGQTYQILIGKYGTSPLTDSATLRLLIAEDVSNDLFANAKVISGFPAAFVQDINGSTVTLGDPVMCVTNYQNTVWFRYVATVSDNLIVSTTGSDYDTVLGVYRGTTAAGLTQVGCNDDTGGQTSQVLFNAAAGQTYYIMVAKYGTTPASSPTILNLTIPQPVSNDLFSRATVITEPPLSITQNIRNSTVNTTDPALCPTIPGILSNTVWFKYTPKINEFVFINTDGSEYDTVMGVYRGTESALTLVACDDDSGAATASNLTFAATANTAYYIVVAHYGTAVTVDTDLVINFLQPKPISPPGAAPLRNRYTTETTTLSWGRITWATEYEIQVSLLATFPNPLAVSQVVPGSTLEVTTPPLPNGRYYWRVRAKNASGIWGAWSIADSFTIEAP